MKGDFQAHQTRFPRLQSDGMRRRAISGAAVQDDSPHDGFVTASAVIDDVFVNQRQPIQTSSESLQRPQLSALPPSRYDWQDHGARQAPPAHHIPPPVFQIGERYLPNTGAHFTTGLNPPFTPVSRHHTFNYDHQSGREHNYYPSSDGNSAGAGRPYLPFENITATRVAHHGPGSQHIPTHHPSVNPTIQGGPRRDLCSSPYFDARPASNPSAAYDGRQHEHISLGRPTSTHTGYATPVEPRQSNMGARLLNPRTPSHQVTLSAPGFTSTSPSYHQNMGDERRRNRDASVPGDGHLRRSHPGNSSDYSGMTSGSGAVTQYMLAQASSQISGPNSLRLPGHQPQTASHISSCFPLSRNTRSRAMSTRSTLITPELSDSDNESEGQDSILVPVLNNLGRVYEDLGVPLTPQLERAVEKSSPTVASDVRDRIICAISESRSSSVIGVAVVNVTTRTVDLVRVLNDDRFLYQLLGDTLWRLMPLGPEKIVVVDNSTHSTSPNWLIPHLESDFPGVPVVPVDRKHWNEEEGRNLIERLALRSQVTALQTDLEGHFYTWCAFSAAINFIQSHLGIYFTRNSLRITHVQAVDTMGLDRTTVVSLELLQNTRGTVSKKSTLFGVLNHTQTPQGQRLLRTTLLQPSTAREDILERYDSVEELVTKEGLLGELRQALKDIVRIDFERIALWLSQEASSARQPLEQGLPAGTAQGVHLSPHLLLSRAEQDVNNILMLKAYLLGVAKLHDVIDAAGCSSSLLRCISDRFSQEYLQPIQAAVEEMLADDASYSTKPIDLRNNRIWAVKAQDNQVLDQARSSYKALTNELDEYFKTLESQFDGMLGSIRPPKLILDRNRRYRIQFDYSDVEHDLQKNRTDVEKEKFGRVCRWNKATIAGIDVVDGVRDKRHFTCTTTKLLQWSTQIQLQADIVTQESDRLITELIGRLQQHPDTMFGISDAVAMLDMLCSFAQVATTKDYVRPGFTETMVLKEARNPIVEIRKEQFVANDVYSGDERERFQVITGGNMSGKSTFIRTVALIQIMAQMGSFVPAQYAFISICDRVFARVSTGDAPENNLGTFGVEMRETDVILKMATEQSMIIMDELGRGTSPDDGLPLATSVCEGLILKKSRVFFATHFTELARILNGFYHRDVLNVHFPGLCRTNRRFARTPITEISLPHTISPGPVQSEDYGIELARCILSEWAVDRAEQILQVLRNGPVPSKSDKKAWQARLNKILLALPPLLKDSMQSRMDDPALESYLDSLRAEFTIRMSEPEPEDGDAMDEGEDKDNHENLDDDEELEEIAEDEDLELKDAEELNNDEDQDNDMDLDDTEERDEDDEMLDSEESKDDEEMADSEQANPDAEMPDIDQSLDDERMTGTGEFIDAASGMDGPSLTNEHRAPEADMSMDINIPHGHWNWSSPVIERRAPEANMGVDTNMPHGHWSWSSPGGVIERRAPEANMGAVFTPFGQKRPAEDDNLEYRSDSGRVGRQKRMREE
ncbi:muts domain V-domain-containing protein [Sordaria brevicollis]|uniref:DNA mismatch repair protein MSH3 n=1 Tax=Sordaria brevicollis TaxID=83679 RepID=A0AAE0P8S1_SORBR|nr:muts domain V-domain-containing protein [Sordaria brevicollis]